MNASTFCLESWSTHSYASKYGDVDVMWSSDSDTDLIRKIADNGCLDDAHDDFVRHILERSEDFFGSVWVRNDVSGEYVLIIT